MAQTLQDLLAGAKPQEPQYVTTEPQAPQGMSPEESALYQAILSSDYQGQRREPEKPSRLGQVFMGLGDSVNAYASVLGRAPQLKSDSLGEYMQYLQRQKFATEQSNERIDEANARRKLAGASFLYNKKQRQEEIDQAAADKKALRQQTVEDAQTKRTLELEDEANKRKFILDKEGRDRDWDLKIQKANFAHTEAMEAEQNKARYGDKEAEKVLTGFSLGSRIVGGFRRGLGADPKTGAPPVPPLVERLKKGESGDQIRREFESEMNEEGIFGKARDLTRDLFNEQLLRAAREVEKQAENPPAEDSPYGPFTGGVNAWDEAIKGALPPPRP